MPQITDREWELLLSKVDAGFAGVNARLDTLNGRTQEHGEAIATLQERTAGSDRKSNGGVVASILAIILTALQWLVLR
jgi:hypothetical protein